MILRLLRFTVILLTSLATGLSFAHIMEMPVKLRYDAELYARVNSTMYFMFGQSARVVVVGSVLGSAILASFVRGRRSSTFAWTLAGAILLAVGLFVWWLIVYPVNAEAARTAEAELPQMWMRLRSRGEYGHVAYFVLQFLGLSALVISVLVETPAKPRSEPEV